MLQARLMHEGSIPTSKTPKISFLCGLDKDSRNLRIAAVFFICYNVISKINKAELWS